MDRRCHGGRTPRGSRRLAYWTGSFIGFAQAPHSYRSFIVDIAGGTPREITGFTNSRFPVWSPDGTRLILSASQAEVPTTASYDWWVVRFDGQPTVATGARFLLASAVAPGGGEASPATWTGNRVLTSKVITEADLANMYAFVQSRPEPAKDIPLLKP